MDDEYVDYSCSTPLERLARDVSTQLRAWHVDKGSDRHVHSQLRLRSEVIVWKWKSSDIELELVLWDDGEDRMVDGDSVSVVTTSVQEESNDSSLPFSLRRKCGVDLTSSLDSFSTMFGIGQHITLTPNNPNIIPDDVKEYICSSVPQRHGTRLHSEYVVATLTSWLQTALNIAGGTSDCYFPMLAVWGKYQPEVPSPGVYPSWFPLSKEIAVHPKHLRRRKQDQLNISYLPAIVSGQLRSEDYHATLQCCALRPGQRWTEPTQWTTWANLLKGHCQLKNIQGVETVNLWAARHVYSWIKTDVRREDRWRSLTRQPSSISMRSSHDDAKAYRRECRNVALWLIEGANRANEDNPLWGPKDDPVAFLHTLVTWNSPRPPLAQANVTNDEGTDDSEARLPLLLLPLKIRSNVSSEERLEMESSIVSSILDPSRSSLFQMQLTYDERDNEASLAASQRCVLAALIRAATLPRETLITHIVDYDVISHWNIDRGNAIARDLALRASVDEATLLLVEAMDWRHSLETAIGFDQAEERVENVLDGRLYLEFPSPPDHNLDTLQSDEWCALKKSAPPGRLVSLLLSHMASVRTPASMSMIWNVFIQELRQRWEAKESLANMNFIPGLDPPTDVAAAKRCFSTVGSKANFAAQVNCSEPDPDDNHCLIGQKIQVLNICIEACVAEEMREIEEVESKRMKASPAHHGNAVLDMSNVSTGCDDEDTSSIEQNTSHHSPGESRIHNSSRSVSERSSRSAVTTMSMYYDAEEDNSMSGGNLDTQNEIGVTRKGARCPVHGASLASRDQLYAPYLQRPTPLTDDVIAQRRLMLRRQQGTKASSSVKQRIDVAQRLQRPKLFSDMQAFKAANPGCTFEDFVNWYGNPENPLEGFDEEDRLEGKLPGKDSVGARLDKAAEAIRVLEETRTFWQRTWEQAASIPVVEQERLFDAGATAEMTLDFLETIHPASLLCQIMSVSLASAYFALVVSADDAARLVVVRNALVRLRDNVVRTLSALSIDATFGDRATSSPRQSSTTARSLVSIESLTSASQACIALSEAEVQVSRARSLLQKFPKMYRVVDRLMSTPSGTFLSLNDSSEQQSVLAALEGMSTAEPATREYVIRNTNESTPAQLYVKHDMKASSTAGGDLLLALSTTSALY